MHLLRAIALLSLTGACRAPEPGMTPPAGGGDTDSADTDSADSGDTGDTGDGEPSCGVAEFHAESGSVHDYTEQFTAGDELTLDEAGTLTFCTGTWFVLLTVEARVEILGLGDAPEDTVLSGGESGTILALSGADAGVLVQNLTLDRGAARGEGNRQAGGGLRCEDGALATLRSVILSNNTGYDGGGLYGGTGCQVQIEDSVFTANTATDDGGALRLDDSSATLTRVRFEGNQGRDGGAVLSWQSALDMQDVQFSDNVATDSQGGAMLHYFGDLTVEDAIFEANRSHSWGGALALFGPTTLARVSFEGNETDEAGGAIYLYTADATLGCTGCSFTANLPDDLATDSGQSMAPGLDASFECDLGGCE